MKAEYKCHSCLHSWGDKCPSCGGEDFKNINETVKLAKATDKNGFLSILLNESTLPEDQQWCEVLLGDGSKPLLAKYVSDEEAFFPVDEKPKLLISAYDVGSWKELEIDWSFERWTERRENLALIVGSDKYNNDYHATGIMNGQEEVLEVEDIERVGASNSAGQ